MIKNLNSFSEFIKIDLNKKNDKEDNIVKKCPEIKNLLNLSSKVNIELFKMNRKKIGLLKIDDN